MRATFEIEPAPQCVERIRRSRDDWQEIERRIALYHARAMSGLDVFTGRHEVPEEQEVGADDVIQPPPPISRGRPHRCGADSWRRYESCWKCVPCSRVWKPRKRSRSAS